MTLTEFLLARIAEDEAEVRSHALVFLTKVSSGQPIVGVEWSEERLLAECDAKRRIVERADLWKFDSSPYGRESGLMLRYLALPYADHPDYRQEWTP